MKSSRTFIAFFIILVCVLIFIPIRHSFRKRSIDLRHKQIRLLIDKIEAIKEEFATDPKESVTKADLAALAEITDHQNSIAQLQMENKIELSKYDPIIFPDYFLVILVLWLSFQLKEISKQIEKRSGKTELIPNENYSEEKS